jgi:hypothetical protein
VGDPHTASTIPNPRGKGVLKYRGEVVKTWLKEKNLEEIARQTRGLYIPAHTRELPLGEVFGDYLETRAARALDEDRLSVYQQQYAWFLGGALALLAGVLIIPRQ